MIHLTYTPFNEPHGSRFEDDKMSVFADCIAPGKAIPAPTVASYDSFAPLVPDFVNFDRSVANR